MESAVAETTSSHPSTGDDTKEETKEGHPPAPDTSVPFSEILRLVQTGQNIPGLQKLNVTATHGSPTPSQMTRRAKPWEITP